MKNIDTMFKSLAVLLSVFFVSCSTNESRDVVAEKQNTKFNRAAAPPLNLPHGKLIINNQTPFYFSDDVNSIENNNVYLMVKGATGGVYDPSILLSQPITIGPNQMLEIKNFETPFLNGYSNISHGGKWIVGSSSFYGLTDGLVANDQYRSIDSNRNQYCNWYGMKTGGDGTGLVAGYHVGFYFICDPLTGAVNCNNPQPKYDINNNLIGTFTVTGLVDANGDTIIDMTF
ncbi:MAG: hypothetical protein H7174_06105 [Flavobacterium sp.]|nr:hypothetical protein [Flavobacterium sp.]